jgi:Tol biopolymer transport system component
MHNKIILIAIISSCVFLFSGCVTTKTKKDLPATGKVSVVIEKEISDEKTGAILIQAERLDEIAERSVTDKGAEALLTPQRFANIGSSYFSSYSVGTSNEIIVSIYNQEGKSGSDLWIFKNGKMRLTKTNYFNQHPSFSTDGKSVYFAASRGKRNLSKYDQNSYIWRMPSDGAGGLTRIGTPVYQFFYPLESPDGSKILFSSREFYENSPFIWYMQKNGALPTQLKQGLFATWLDSNTIVFSAKDENTGFYSIWTSIIDGSNLTQIIFDNEMDCIFPEVDYSGQFIAYVKQSPNKNKIVEMQSRDIHVFHFKDGLSQQITTNISRDDMPHWSPKGDYLYFRSSRGLAWNIWRLSTTFLNK